MAVTWSRSALKQLRRLDRSEARRLAIAVAAFSETGQGQVRTVTNIEGATHRLRVGDYRALINLGEGEQGFDVVAVAHRREIYR